MKSPASIMVVVLVMAFLAMGAADSAHSDDDSIARLEGRVSSLERRVRTLESKLQSIVAKPKAATRGSATPPRDRSRPKGWRRREFNGVPYYIIPVERKPSQAAQRTR